MPFRPIVERRRRFVVVVDDSPECRVAMRFASARAAHVEGGSLVLFHVIPPVEFQHWLGVQETMREEQYEEAEELLGHISEELSDYCGVRPEIYIREGNPPEELQKFIEEEKDLFALFLGASTDETPAPLIDYFTGPMAGKLTCPVVIVPGKLATDEIDEMA